MQTDIQDALKQRFINVQPLTEIEKPKNTPYRLKSSVFKVEQTTVHIWERNEQNEANKFRIAIINNKYFKF